MLEDKRSLVIYSAFAAFGVCVLVAWIVGVIAQREYYALTLSTAFLFCVYQFWYVLPADDD